MAIYGYLSLFIFSIYNCAPFIVLYPAPLVNSDTPSEHCHPIVCTYLASIPKESSCHLIHLKRAQVTQFTQEEIKSLIPRKKQEFKSLNSLKKSSCHSIHSRRDQVTHSTHERRVQVSQFTQEELLSLNSLKKRSSHAFHAGKKSSSLSIHSRGAQVFSQFTQEKRMSLNSL